MSKQQERHKSRLAGVYWYMTNDGKRWGAIVERERDWQTGKRRPDRKHGFRTQEEAHAWRVEQLDKRRRGDHVEPSMMPLGQWADQWLDAQSDKRPSTLRAYRMRLTHLLEVAGDVPLSRVTPQVFESLFADLHRRGYEASTLLAFHRCYKTMFQRAVDQQMLYRNPLNVVRAPAGEKHRPRTWTAEQRKQFLAVNGSDATWGVVWWFMTETWVRVGELIDLRWDAVDLDAGEVRIERTITIDDKQRRTSGTPKSQAGRRTIPISRPLVDLLRQHRDRQRFRNTETDLVFPSSRSGTWLRQTTIADALKAGCIRAGVPIINPHGIRHTGATIARQHGIDPNIVAERLGHADIAFMLRTYRHTDADEHRRATDQIAALLSVS